MHGISKSFPGTRALDDVSFACGAGEVHAICGENGAGKSTLIKVLGGVYRPDAGTIRIAGREAAFAHPVAARRAGISIIHQELSLLPDRTVAENIHLGMEPMRFGMLDRAAMRSRAQALLERLGSGIAADQRAGDLSIAQQQTVEIAKALAPGARIMVMDEPTAALDDAEAAQLLELVRLLRAEGMAVVYISHRMAEVQRVADRVTVLKDGRLIATDRLEAMPIDRIVRLMVGRELAEFYPPRAGAATGQVLLQIEGGGNGELRDIELAVRAGEIVAVAGLDGSGKTALARAIFGDAPFERGTMRLDGKVIAPGTPRAAIAHGIGYLPDDRKREALLMQQDLRDNVMLTLRAYRAALRAPEAGDMDDAEADRTLRRLDVRAGRFDQEIRTLSGGNQQKVIIGRWLVRAPRLLLFCEPTRGIDVASKASIYHIMRELADDGCGILMVSSDLPEVVGVSDRIVVMHAGRIVGECPAGAAEEEVMALAVGHPAASARETAS